MFPWDDLIKLIEREWIIPVVGSDLYRKGNKKVYSVIANKLVSEPPFEDDKHFFQKAAAQFLNEDGKVRYYSDLTDQFKQIVNELALGELTDLLHLAQVDKFKIFINTTYDDFLFDSLKRAGRTEILKLNYTPNEKDLNALDKYKEHLEKRNSAIIFNVFGNISNTKPSYTEIDIIESITDLQGDIRTANNSLFNKLKNSSYLFIGCNFKNWLLRFIARSITNKPFDPHEGEQRRFFSSDIKLDDPDDLDLKVFIESNPPESRPSRFFFDGTTTDFMKEFHERVKEKPWVIDLHWAFVSFNGEDRLCAEKINLFLKGKKIKTWLDSDGQRAGNKVDDTILNAIIKSKIFLVIASSGYINNPGYQDLEFFWLRKFNDNERRNDPIIVMTLAIGKIDKNKLPNEANNNFWFQIQNCEMDNPDTMNELNRLADKIFEICAGE